MSYSNTTSLTRAKLAGGLTPSKPASCQCRISSSPSPCPNRFAPFFAPINGWATKPCFGPLLPSGFQKVRHYGFFSPTCSPSIERLRLLIAATTGVPLLLDLSASAPLPGPFCPDCGGRLRVLAI
jgi:hypothetical protein